MKKIIYSLCLTSVFLACSGDQPVSTEDLISAKDLKGLKAQKEKNQSTQNTNTAHIGGEKEIDLISHNT